MNSHQFKKLSALAASVMLGAIAVQSASAAVPDFLYVPAGGAQTTATTVAPGATVTLNVYLQGQTSTGISVVTNDGGLGTAGLAITFLKNNGTGSNSTIKSFAFDTTDFTGPIQLPTVTATSVNGGDEGAPTSGGITFGNLGGGTSPSTPSNEIFLGTVTFIAGSAGSSTVFNIGAEDGVGGGYTLTNNHGYDVDVASNNGKGAPSYVGVGTNVSTYTINAGTPEPASIGLLASGGLLALAPAPTRTAITQPIQ